MARPRRAARATRTVDDLVYRTAVTPTNVSLTQAQVQALVSHAHLKFGRMEDVLTGGFEPYLERHAAKARKIVEESPAAGRSVASAAQQVSSLADVVLVRLVGRGAFGEVWLAQDTKTDQFIALKKYYYGEDRDGFNKACLREITLLKLLGNHPNIMTFYGVMYSLPQRFGHYGALQYPMSDEELENIFVALNRQELMCETAQTAAKPSVWLSFEFSPFDLNAYIRSREETSCPLTAGEVKLIIIGVLRGLEHCHRNHVLHRDIKSTNILLDWDGGIKLADFGLARRVVHRRVGVCIDDILALPIDPSCEADPRLTNRVVTLWYRSPELLLGCREYTAAADLWSVGCLVYEVLTSKYLFTGATEEAMIEQLFSRLGIPTEKEWPGWTRLPYAKSVPLNKINPVTSAQLLENLKQKITVQGGPNAWSFVQGLLAMNPAQRFTATEALNHPWLTAGVASQLKVYPDTGLKSNSYSIKKERDRLNSMHKTGVVRHVCVRDQQESWYARKAATLNPEIKNVRGIIAKKTDELNRLKTFIRANKAVSQPSSELLEDGEIH